jgi:hypothetical protein
MNNPNPECPRDDCAFSYSGGASTLVAYIPIYDKNGVNTNPDANIPHKFDLKGFRVDDAFLGCKNCWWRAERGEVMKPICPECGEQLYAYYVREEDL